VADATDVYLNRYSAREPSIRCARHPDPHTKHLGQSAYTVDSVRLAGGFSARLCHACVNAWHRHACANGWREYESVRNRMQAEIATGDAHNLLADLEARGNALEDKLFALAEAFVSTPVEG
jgi:hypothetical protein